MLIVHMYGNLWPTLLWYHAVMFEMKFYLFLDSLSHYFNMKILFYHLKWADRWIKTYFLLLYFTSLQKKEGWQCGWPSPRCPKLFCSPLLCWTAPQSLENRKKSTSHSLTPPTPNAPSLCSLQPPFFSPEQDGSSYPAYWCIARHL